MSFWELLVLSIGLAMDAFAVSICKGLAMEKTSLRKQSLVGGWFGGFQALMPLIGWAVGSQFAGFVERIDHWIAFVLLGLIGANMIREALSDEEEDSNDDISARAMFPLAVATSIDALAVGVTFAFLNVSIWLAIIFIGVVTFVISFAGVKIGNIFGEKYKTKAEIAGGAILVLLGIKILLTHLL